MSSTPSPPSMFSSMISIMNNLQDIFAKLPNRVTVDLPQVAVVGSQSSGKSSVLEALVGRDFLPRGCEICTRRPLCLQLENCEAKEREWGEFRHLPGKRFYEFEKIRKEIQAETEREVGYNKGVSDKQIRLKISSPNVLNITLVDLPGITKVPVGDQPSDIEARIRKMIMSYIKQEACIILAVSPANSDLATSDALQMAKEADPSGIRTIGVITKLDIMDRGTNALNFLLGKVVPLRLGYVGVVNRCQEDINKNRSIAEALSLEEKFFQDNSIYNGLSQHCGIPLLAKKLNQILEQHIRTVLPKLKTELKTHLLTVDKELSSYGDTMESKAEQGVILLDIMRRHSEAFTARVEGKSQEMSTKELSGGARIHYIFQSIFVKSLEEVDPCEDVTDEDIRTAIQNATGPRNAIFVPEVHFEVLVRKQVARLLDPSLQCLRLVYDELVKMGRDCEATEIKRYPVLRKRLDEVRGRILDDGIKSAERMIGNIIEIEMDYTNTSHPNFIGGHKAVEMALQQLKSSQNAIDSDLASTLEKGPQSRCVFPKAASNGVLPNQMDYTNTSHPNCIGGLGGHKAVEMTLQQLKSSQNAIDSDLASTLEKGPQSRVFPKAASNGVSPNQGSQTQPNNGGPAVLAGNSSTRTWALSSIFGTRASSVKSAANISFNRSVPDIEQSSSVKSAANISFNGSVPDIEQSSSVKSAANISFNGSVPDIEQSSSVIRLSKPPSILRPPETQTDIEAVEVSVVKLLVRSYYNIVRKNIEDLVPKTIMHFLVNNTKRGLLGIFIQKLYREDLFEEMLKEEGEVVIKRKQASELLQVLQQAVQTLDEIEAEVSF